MNQFSRSTVEEGLIGLYDLIEFFDDSMDCGGVELGLDVFKLDGTEGA